MNAIFGLLFNLKALKKMNALLKGLIRHCTVVELYREGVTKVLRQMEVNETFILFYIWQIIENTL